MKKIITLFTLATMLIGFSSCINEENCENCNKPTPNPLPLSEKIEGLWEMVKSTDAEGNLQTPPAGEEKTRYALKVNKGEIEEGTLNGNNFSGSYTIHIDKETDTEIVTKVTVTPGGDTFSRIYLSNEQLVIEYRDGNTIEESGITGYKYYKKLDIKIEG